jgi:PKD repeat protein
MTRRLFGFIVAVPFFVFTQAYSFAPSPSIFGPKTYTREKGKPEEIKETFQVCALSGVYKLTVENGLYSEIGENEKDKGRGKEKDGNRWKEERKTHISAAEIEVNGKEIIASDFKKHVAKVEKTILLHQGENQIGVEVKGKPGAYITLTIECSSGCLEPKITVPTSGITINKSQAIVQGNLSNVYGETGIIINGRLAQTQGKDFAGIIPLQQGQNTIIAAATDACGYKAYDTIMINTETRQEVVRLTANPDDGIPTLNVTLDAETYLSSPATNYAWDTDGDGILEQTGPELTQITASYQTPGLYFPTVTVTDTRGNTYTETAIIDVIDRTEIDSLLKAKWEGMKTRLAYQDVEGAIVYITSNSQARYREIFTALGSGLPEIVQNMQDIQHVYVNDRIAKYRIRKNETYGGQMMTITYYIYFVIDGNGIWTIDKF